MTRIAALRDPELVRLLAQEPELLAIADAIAASGPVRHRRTSRHWVVLLAVCALAGIAVAAALAAQSGWWFSRQTDGASGATQVRFHGSTWTLNAFMSGGGRWFELELERAGTPIAGDSGSSILAVPGVPEKLIPNPPKPSGPAFGASWFQQGGGQIWFGDARPEISTIEITDAHGQLFRTATVAPSSYKTAFRLWVVVLPSSLAETIAGYDSRGRLVLRRSVYGLGSALELH